MQILRFGIAAGLAAAATGQKVKAMLLGDSITEISCWRPMKPSAFDTHHEGHSGWQACDIAKNNIAGWVQNTNLDVVQFMLGTNDVNIGKANANSILDSYTSLINAIRSANPKVKIIINKLIPTSWSDATIESLNSAIPNWVQQRSTSQSPIVNVDCSRAAGFTNAMLRSDGVHPNDQGDQFLAKQIGPKLIQAIKDVKAGQ